MVPGEKEKMVPDQKAEIKNEVTSSSSQKEEIDPLNQTKVAAKPLEAAPPTTETPELLEDPSDQE
jgi:hypothetical protein